MNEKFSMINLDQYRALAVFNKAISLEGNLPQKMSIRSDAFLIEDELGNILPHFGLSPRSKYFFFTHFLRENVFIEVFCVSPKLKKKVTFFFPCVAPVGPKWFPQFWSKYPIHSVAIIGKAIIFSLLGSLVFWKFDLRRERKEFPVKGWIESISVDRDGKKLAAIVFPDDAKDGLARIDFYDIRDYEKRGSLPVLHRLDLPVTSASPVDVRFHTSGTLLVRWVKLIDGKVVHEVGIVDFELKRLRFAFSQIEAEPDSVISPPDRDGFFLIGSGKTIRWFAPDGVKLGEFGFPLPVASGLPLLIGPEDEECENQLGVALSPLATDYVVYKTGIAAHRDLQAKKDTPLYHFGHVVKVLYTKKNEIIALVRHDNHLDILRAVIKRREFKIVERYSDREGIQPICPTGVDINNFGTLAYSSFNSDLRVLSGDFSSSKNISPGYGRVKEIKHEARAASFFLFLLLQRPS